MLRVCLCLPCLFVLFRFLFLYLVACFFFVVFVVCCVFCVVVVCLVFVCLCLLFCKFVFESDGCCVSVLLYSNMYVQHVLEILLRMLLTMLS